MEVLFEYRGSRTQLRVAEKQHLLAVISGELRRLAGKPRAEVLTSSNTMPAIRGQPEVYLLQKWSTVWDCYVDVRHYNEVQDGERVAVIARPKPPSGLFLLCCCGRDSSYSSNMVGGSGQNKTLPKGDEIQSVDYQFRAVLEEEQQSWEDNVSVLSYQHTELSTPLGEGENYIRGQSGSASWKIVCTKKKKEQSPSPGPDTRKEECSNVGGANEVGNVVIVEEEEREESLERVQSISPAGVEQTSITADTRSQEEETDVEETGVEVTGGGAGETGGGVGVTGGGVGETSGGDY